MFVEGLVLDVVVCITCCTVVPSELRDGVSYHTRTRHVTARTQLEDVAVRFDNGWNRLLGQSCDEVHVLESGDTSGQPTQLDSVLIANHSCVDHHRVVLVADGGNVSLNLVALP